jgi:predicted RNA-binding protein
MSYWIASGNRENGEVAVTENIWGGPKWSKGLHIRVKSGDTMLMYV